MSGVGIYVIGCFSLLLNTFFFFALYERTEQNAGVERHCSLFVSKYVPLCLRNLADFNYNLAAIFLRCKNSNHDHYHIKMAINVCKTTRMKKKRANHYIVCSLHIFFPLVFFSLFSSVCKQAFQSCNTLFIVNTLKCFNNESEIMSKLHLKYWEWNHVLISLQIALL